MKLTNISMNNEGFKILQNAALRVLSARMITYGAGFEIKLEIDESLTDERYIISSGESSASIRAADDLSLFAAFGRFLRISRFLPRIPLPQADSRRREW